MQEAELIAAAAVSAAIGTVYIHLCSGEELKIEDVQQIGLTETHVIFRRGDLGAVMVERRDVYYSCCQPGAAPPAY